jgi:hypothetical protein
MDPRFSFSKSYPVQHPDWAEAIQNSKVDYSIEPIGRALRILYGNIPKPKQISAQSQWHHQRAKIDEYVLNDLCDFTVRVSLLSNELTKTDYKQLLEWILILRNQYRLENLSHFARPDGFTYIFRGEYNNNFHDYMKVFQFWGPGKEISYQDGFDFYRFWRIGTFRGDLRDGYAEAVKKWANRCAEEVEGLIPVSAEWARYSLNESDLASLLKSLDFAHFDAATQTEAQTEAEENDEPVLRRSNRKRSHAEVFKF